MAEKGRINVEEAREMMLSAGNHTFTVVFRKKDGTMREMNCRLGVKKHLQGGESTTKHLDHLITVCDMQVTKDVKTGKERSPYRNINLDTLSRLKINGADYTVL